MGEIHTEFFCADVELACTFGILEEVLKRSVIRSDIREGYIRDIQNRMQVP
jgi:hypothetical protein